MAIQIVRPVSVVQAGNFSGTGPTLLDSVIDGTNDSYAWGRVDSGDDPLKFGLPSSGELKSNEFYQIDLQVAYSSQDSFGSLPAGLACYIDDGSPFGVASFDFPPPATAIRDVKLTRSGTWSAAQLADAELVFSVARGWHLSGFSLDVFIYEITLTYHYVAGGYDDPPEPLPSVLFLPPRRRFVYPY